MNTQNTGRTAEQVKKEIRAIVDSPDFYTDFKKLKPKINALEEEKRRIELNTLLTNKNREFERLRELAFKVWNIGEILEDITTADGSPHKTKAKKYPALHNIDYLRMKFDDGKITEINAGGQKFTLYKRKFEYNKPTEYTRPANFNEFLELNSLPLKPFTIEEHEQTAKELKEATEELKRAIEKYSHVRNRLDIHSLQFWGLAEQYNVNCYEYKLK